MDSFTRAYILTALWSSNDNADDTGGEPLDRRFSPEDVTGETFERMNADAQKFWSENSADITGAEGVKCGPDFDQIDRAAHDFWLTRNGHGAGFWDGDWPEPQASRLDAAAKAFGSCDLYIGDDGELYVA